MEIENEDKLGHEKAIKNTKEVGEAINIINRYYYNARLRNNIIGKQVELLKQLEKSDNFFENLGSSRTHIYFKI